MERVTYMDCRGSQHGHLGHETDPQGPLIPGFLRAGPQAFGIGNGRQYQCSAHTFMNAHPA
jgi:hypothetical protein